MVFTSQVFLVRVHLCNFLPSSWSWDHQLCCPQVRLVHSWQPYLTTVRIHIMATTNQISEEKRLSIITLRTNNKHKEWSLDQERWTDGLYMHGPLVWWCGAALLVTLLEIYSKLKAHRTSMATTASCSDMPSHFWFAFSWTIIYFSIGQWPQTHLQAIWPGRRVMECCARWPGLHSHLT